MDYELGKRIAFLRRQRGITQEGLANQMSVSPQAVSKWETGASYPDIAMLPQLAEYFHTTIDELLRGPQIPETRLVPEEERKDIKNMMFKVIVDSVAGDRVRVNLPVALVKVALEMGMNLPEMGNAGKALQNIDIEALMLMIDRGVIGELVSVESADGDHVLIYVE